MRGVQIRERGPNPLADLDPRGSISASGFGPGGPYPLADMDRGVQIRWDTGSFTACFKDDNYSKEHLPRAEFCKVIFTRVSQREITTNITPVNS